MLLNNIFVRSKNSLINIYINFINLFINFLINIVKDLKKLGSFNK